MLKGLDAWSGQGEIPWDKLPDLDFAVFKCVEGNQGMDPRFWANVRAAQAAGKLVGAYHFLFPLPHIDPAQQARQFYESSRGFGSNVGELPPWLDWEWPAPEQWKKWGVTAQSMATWTRACAEEMTRLFGCPPMIYIYPYFLDCLIRDGADLAWAKDYKLVLADYSPAGRWPPMGWNPRLKPAWPWDRWSICQIDGDNGMRLPNGVDADFCVFNGDMDDLKALAGLGPEKPFYVDGGIIHPALDEEILIGRR